MVQQGRAWKCHLTGLRKRRIAVEALWLGSGIYKIDAPLLMLEKPRSGLRLDFKLGRCAVHLEIG